MRWNRYAYAENNPLRFVDPSGFDEEAVNPLEGTGSARSYAEVNTWSFYSLDLSSASLPLIDGLASAVEASLITLDIRPDSYTNTPTTLIAGELNSINASIVPSLLTEDEHVSAAMAGAYNAALESVAGMASLALGPMLGQIVGDSLLAHLAAPIPPSYLAEDYRAGKNVFLTVSLGMGMAAPMALEGAAGLAFGEGVSAEAATAGSAVGEGVEEIGLGGSIRHVNPTGGTFNCANCAVATDATLSGSPASALPGGVTQASQLARELGGAWVPTTGARGITTVMERAGPGARGIVFGGRGGDVGHFFNAVNQGGVVRFLDGQTGRAANLSTGYDSFWLMRTH